MTALPSLFGQNLLSKPACLLSPFGYPAWSLNFVVLYDLTILRWQSEVRSRTCFSMMVLPAKLGKPTSDLQGRKAKPLGSLMHLPFSPMFTRNCADVVQVCQEDCDDMWWHVMTCWKMWWVRWPRSGRVAKIFICTVLGGSAVWALFCCHFEVWMSWPKELGVVGCGWRSCYKCSQHPSTGFSLI